MYLIFNRFHLESSLIGTYHNVNFENSPIFPNTTDTLTIFGNNEFYSNNLGHGSYEISYGMSGTEIYFSGRNGIACFVSRTWTGAIKIVVFSDLNHYYSKLSCKAKRNLQKIEKAKKQQILEKEKIKKAQQEIENSLIKVE